MLVLVLNEKNGGGNGMTIHNRAKQLENGPIWDFLGASIQYAQDGESIVEMNVMDEVKQMYGTVHGGILGTLIDMAMASAVTSTMSEEENAVTVDLSLHYLSAAKEGKLIGKGKVIKRGKRMAFLEANIYSDDRLLVTGSASFMIIQKEKK